MSTTLTPATGRRPQLKLHPALHYTVHSSSITAKNWSFVLFSVALPVVLYLVFSQMFGGSGGGTWRYDGPP